MIPAVCRLVLPALATVLVSAQEPLLPVVMVADVAGKVLRGGGQPLSLAEGVPARRELRLAAGARLVVIHLRTGEELVFKGPARLRFDGEGRPEGAVPAGRRSVASLQGGFRLEPGAWAQASVVMRKEVMPAESLLQPESLLEREEALPFDPPSREVDPEVWLQPKGTAVLEPRPEFRWRLPDRGSAARFRLEEISGGLVLEETVPDGLVRLAAEQSLTPGRRYRWRLAWSLAGEEERSLEGEFEVLPEAEAQLYRSRRPRQDADFPERLAFAVALESRGLVQEARPHWLRLAAERPEDEVLRRFSGR